MNNQTHLNDKHFPKYIRFSDYQTAWTKGPDNNGGAQLYEEEHKIANNREAKSRRKIESVSDKSATDQNNRWNDDIGDAKRKEIGPTSGANTQMYKSPQTEADFTCNDKPAGFYPDTDSACRVSKLISSLRSLMNRVTSTPSFQSIYTDLLPLLQYWTFIDIQLPPPDEIRREVPKLWTLVPSSLRSGTS